MLPANRKKKLSMDKKNCLAQFLLQNQQLDGTIRHKAQKEAAQMYGLTTRSIRTIWMEVKHQQSQGIPVHFQQRSRGIIHKDKWKIDEEKIRNLSVLERSTIRKMAKKLNVSKSLLGIWIKEKLIRPHTSAIKPALSKVNKLARLKFALSHLRFDDDTLKFQSTRNVIHIDEKWFFMTKTTDIYYLLPNEIEPHRSCQSKRFIQKVMFMSVVGRPHFSSEGECLFDGKYGIFPFTTQEPAKRKSKNRSKGTLETKAIQSITKEVIKACLINQIIPAIKAKWPTTEPKEIIIQQDNARPHILATDKDFIEAANTDGFKISLICQPPNSPDTNINDLGFFRAIQSLQDDKMANTVDDLLKNVLSSYQELTTQTLNNVFLTLQGCYIEILKVKGGNDYKIPHMNKGRLSRMGLLPECIEVPEVLVKESLEHLMLPENETGNNYDLSRLTTHYGY
ncbi:uncharacterized protein LOC131003072 [Salvia miltiorrhiza]|uniref:uncharacterized protein LOC131003072 n=1 Tax=Salvia miltiorrhiza TaxID=226208 RepID=UPI0025AC19CB|nr:uncharacterized protein LOC131003072 [Salvia miltiorrhiza]